MDIDVQDLIEFLEQRPVKVTLDSGAIIRVTSPVFYKFKYLQTITADLVYLTFFISSSRMASEGKNKVGSVILVLGADGIIDDAIYTINAEHPSIQTIHPSLARL